MYRVSRQNDTTQLNDSTLSNISHNECDPHHVSQQPVDVENQVKEGQTAKPESVSEPGKEYEEILRMNLN